MSNDGARIAAALRRSPIYVDPAYAASLPRAERTGLAARIRRSPVPIYVLLVPIVPGGPWPTSEDLATVVQSRLGRGGAFITLDPEFNDVFDVYRWGGTYTERQDSRDAGWAVSYDPAYKTASLGARLGRCVALISTGTGTKTYDRLVSQEFPSSPAPRARPVRHRGGGFPVALPAGMGAVAVAGGALLWLRRRRSRPPAPEAVFVTAHQADLDELRERAEQEVISLGERLESGEPREAELDAYSAAGRVLDRAESVADLAGVLALVAIGRDAPPPCYFNPPHGAGRVRVNWRPPGTRDRLAVRVCAECARAVRDRHVPDVLLDDGRPYYEADTVWAETGYGQLGGDLVRRVLDG